MMNNLHFAGTIVTPPQVHGDVNAAVMRFELARREADGTLVRLWFSVTSALAQSFARCAMDGDEVMVLARLQSHNETLSWPNSVDLIVLAYEFGEPGHLKRHQVMG